MVSAPRTGSQKLVCATVVFTLIFVYCATTANLPQALRPLRHLQTQDLVPEQLGPEKLGPEQLGPEQHDPERLAPEHLGHRTRPLPRVSNYLMYWTPHRTGSASMLNWLRAAGALINVPYRAAGDPYPYSNFTDFSERAASLNTSKCLIVGGHIRITPAEDRMHEGRLGAVISTTRNPVDTLISKYFNRTNRKLSVNFLGSLLKHKSGEARYWFFHWNDYDPCEQLRYYDGAEGCDLTTVAARAERIAQRIDCVVDTEDADKDLRGLCHVMGIAECPEHSFVIDEDRRRLYSELREMKRMTNELDRVLKVSNILRGALMKRRCRFLTDGTRLTTPGLEPPRWPSRGC